MQYSLRIHKRVEDLFSLNLHLSENAKGPTFWVKYQVGPCANFQTG